MLLVACVSCLVGFVLGMATLVVISATMLSSQHSRGEERDAQNAPDWMQVKGHWE